MEPEEFTAFSDAMPEPNKHLIVTNNINAKNAHGEMSHVWLTTFIFNSSIDARGIVSFDEGDREIIRLTHWKYA